MGRPVLSRVHRSILLMQIQNKKYNHTSKVEMSLSVVDGCILRGSCVVIPPAGCSIILQQLHDRDEKFGPFIMFGGQI